MNAKHAYLIMAHNQFNVLVKLLKLLDDSRNDIYVHIDIRADNVPWSELKSAVKKSTLVFVSRNKVSWGGYNGIHCEMELLKAALQGKYAYYHLLSGVDLPLKSQDEIHSFFDQNQGREFVHVERTDGSDVIWRMKWYYPFTDYYGRHAPLPLAVINRILLLCQKLLHINRLRSTPGLLLWKGANWFSITYDFASYVVANEKWIEHHFRYTRNCDEVFLQVLIANSDFKSKLYYTGNDNNYISIMRKIDWYRGTPYVYRTQDYDELMNSPFMFARKFDEETDDKIINMIFQTLGEYHSDH